MYAGIHVKCPLLLSDFNLTLIFLTIFENLKYQILRTSFYGSQVVLCPRAEGRRKEVKSRFSQFCERAKKITRVEVDGRNEHVPLLLERKYAT